jgi:hypothetical protein
MSSDPEDLEPRDEEPQAGTAVPSQEEEELLLRAGLVLISVLFHRSRASQT